MMHHEEKKRQPRYSGPFVTIIRKRLDAYFAITVRSVRDSVPKAIGFYLVRAVQDKLQFELLNTLNKKDKLAELLGEPPHIMEERKTLTMMLQVLQKAIAVLTRDPTLAAIAFEAEAEEQQNFAPPQRPAPAVAAKSASAAVPAPAAPGPAINAATMEPARQRVPGSSPSPAVP